MIQFILAITLIFITTATGYSSFSAKNTTVVYLRVKDFKDCDYTSVTDCALARACKRLFDSCEVIVGPSNVILYKGCHSIRRLIIKNCFDPTDFDWLKFKSHFYSNPEKIIGYAILN